MSDNKRGENSKQRDPDLVHAEVALQRAAIKAWEIAKKTGTAVVTSENNVIREEYPEQTSFRD